MTYITLLIPLEDILKEYLKSSFKVKLFLLLNS